MNFHDYGVATSLEGSQQVIPQGPVAALEFIKNLGTNGGGFFNVNGAHPYENPTPLTNFMEMLAGSTGRCNTGLEFTRRSFKAQSFSRALIEA